jgi:hypothetical protein
MAECGIRITEEQKNENNFLSQSPQGPQRKKNSGIKTQAIIVSGLGIQVPVSWLIFSADSSEAGERKAFVFISK